MKFIISWLCIAICSLTYGKTPPKEIGTLIIGTIFPMTGPQAAYGQEALAGVQLAFEEVKKQNPQLASHIKLLTGDDASTPSGASRAAEELIKQRVSLLIGSVTASSSKAIIEVAEKYKKPLVIPASSSLSLLSKDSSFIFRSCSVDRWQGHLLGNFAIEKLAKKNAAILLNPQDPYSHDIAEFFKRSFTAKGGKIVIKEFYKENSAQFTDPLKKIAASGAEFIMFPTSSYVEAAKVMSEVKRLKLQIPLLGADRWHTPKLALQAGSAFAGHFYPVAYSSQLTGEEKSQQFVEAFKRRLRRYPSPLAAMTYDAFILAVDAFKRAETVRSSELTRALERTRDLAGLLGPVSMNPDHNAEKSGIIMETTPQGSRVRALIHPNGAAN